MTVSLSLSDSPAFLPPLPPFRASGTNANASTSSCVILHFFLVFIPAPFPGEADVGDCSSDGQGRGWKHFIVFSEDEGLSTRQPAGASAVGGGHGGSPNVAGTHPTRGHVPVTEAGLAVAAGRGQ